MVVGAAGDTVVVAAGAASAASEGENSGSGVVAAVRSGWQTSS